MVHGRRKIDAACARSWRRPWIGETSSMQKRREYWRTSAKVNWRSRASSSSRKVAYRLSFFLRVEAVQDNNCQQFHEISSISKHWICFCRIWSPESSKGSCASTSLNSTFANIVSNLRNCFLAFVSSNTDLSHTKDLSHTHTQGRGEKRRKEGRRVDSKKTIVIRRR